MKMVADPKTLGKYELHEELGRGGFGTVYRATDKVLGRDVALKVLHPQLTTDPDFLEKFRNEARLVASLNNPNIVTIYDLGETDGRVYIAMQYMAGESLKRRLEKSGAIPLEETLRIISDVCNGLQSAHKRGLVHRDIKPGNILFDEDGKAVIGDFGLARAVQQSSTTAASSAGGVGTPAYRAPELWLGKPPASPATDIYSLGCVLSEMLSGRVLFDGESTDVVITQHLVTGPQIPDDLPENVIHVLRRMLAKEPNERYSNIYSLDESLELLEPLKQLIEFVPTQKKLIMPELTEPKKKTEEKSFDRRWIYGLVGILGLAVIINVGIKKNEISQRGKEELVVQSIMTATNKAFTHTPKATMTPVPTIRPTLSIGIVKVSEFDSMSMVYVNEGKFKMGSESGKSAEKPVHEVFLDSYWIDQTEVTNEMYAKCVEAGKCEEPSYVTYYNDTNYLDHPVIFVS